jgi:hypothetical protein
MGSWRKLLAQMVADKDPRSYTFEEAAGILTQLGFVARKTASSHKTFRRTVPDDSAIGGSKGVFVGLVKSGHGPMKPIYITKMIATLQENKLLPSDV